MAPGVILTPGGSAHGEPKPLRLDYVPPERERLLVRINEAAAILACGRQHVYDLLTAGEIDAIGRGVSRRIVVASLHDYVARARELSVQARAWGVKRRRT